MSEREIVEHLKSIAVDIANALCGDVRVIGHDAITSVRTMQAKAGPFVVSCLMLDDTLVSYHVDVVADPATRGTDPQPAVMSITAPLPFDLKTIPLNSTEQHATYMFYASEPNTALDEPWKPASEVPLLMWVATKREGEDGENVCFARKFRSYRDLEWVDREGRTTICHTSFDIPTHWRFLPGGEPKDLPKPQPAPDPLFIRQHSSKFGSVG